METMHTDADSTEGRAQGLLRELEGAIIWEVDASAAQVTFVSRSAATTLGYPAGPWPREPELLQKHVHPEDWSRVLETAYRAAFEGGHHTCEHRMLRCDGSTLWVQTSIRRSGSNGSTALVGLTVDITRLKDVEQALRAAEAHSRLLVENLRDYGVFMLAPDGSVASWSSGAQRLKRYRADEVIGAPLSRFFPADELAKGTPAHLLELAELDGQGEYEGWMVRKDGTTFWASLTLTAVVDEQGKLRGFSNVARDLTQRKLMEEALRESEQRFRLLVESQDYGVFMVSPDGVIQSWNRGAQRLQGHRVHDIIGQPLSLLFPDAEVAKGTVAQLLEGAARIGNVNYEGWLVRKGGGAFWGLFTVSSVEDEVGELRGFSILARDVTERKQTEHALRESEAYFRLLVGSVQDYGVFMLSPQGIVESWNQGAQRLKGYRADEAVGLPLSRFFPPEENEKGTPERLLKDAELNGSATHEGWMVRKGGARFWAIVTLSAVEDEHGRLRGISNVARDLTERKQTEDALRESEERLRLLIDSLQDYGVFMMSPQGSVISWSPGAERIKGYKAPEIIGAHVSRFFPEEEVQKGTVDRLLERAAADRRVEYEGWIVRKGGTLAWASVIFSAVTDRDGTLRGFSNIARDLTERRRSEWTQTLLSDVSNLLAGSLDYRTTLNRVAHLATRELARWCVVEILEGQVIQPVAVAHVDPDKEQLLASSVRGVPNDFRAGHGVAYVLQSERPELNADAPDPGWVAQAVGIEEPSTVRELGARSYMCVPLTARGKTFGAIVFVAAVGRRYVEDDVLIAEELARRAALAIDNARLYEQAQTAIRMREEVLAIVSHDLRSPLSTITMAAAQLIADARGSEHGAMAVKIADRIGRASQRMNHMIRDLLDFASIEAGRLSIHVAPHEVEGLITESLEHLQPIAADEGLRLERQGVLGGIEVRCDRERVLQVFSNLIGNAVKFTGAGGTITVSTRQEQGRLVFGVADTGPGIPPEDLPHLFDRYWQAKAGDRMGLGLGLAISKAIIESHGGDIWVESTLGRGTVFYFSLPLAS